MSGRIRTLKPEVLEDERTAHLSHASFRLFIGLILVADDYGNFRANPDQLRGAIFWGAPPDDPRTSEAGGIDALLAELEKPEDDGSPGLITLYRVKGQRYGHLNGWSKNQKVQHPGSPRVPGPNDSKNTDKGAPSGESREVLMKVSGEPPETLTPDLRSPIFDLRSPTRSAPETHPAEPVSSSSGQPAKLTTTERFDAAEVYADAARELSPQHVWGFANRGEREAVANAIETYAPLGASVDIRREWIREQLRAWAKSGAVGFKPFKFVDWLRDPRTIEARRLAAITPTKTHAAQSYKPFEGHK